MWTSLDCPASLVRNVTIPILATLDEYRHNLNNLKNRGIMPQLDIYTLFSQKDLVRYLVGFTLLSVWGMLLLAFSILFSLGQLGGK